MGLSFGSRLHVPFLPPSAAVPGDRRKPRAREACSPGLAVFLTQGQVLISKEEKKIKMEQKVPLLSYCGRARDWQKCYCSAAPQPDQAVSLGRAQARGRAHTTRSRPSGCVGT